MSATAHNLVERVFLGDGYKRQPTCLGGKAHFGLAVALATSRVGASVEVLVSDNSTGMSPQVQVKILQSFFITKPTGEGTGLGLSLSYDIIAQGHGGMLTVESQPGHGTDFTILLPFSAT